MKLGWLLALAIILPACSTSNPKPPPEKSESYGNCSADHLLYIRSMADYLYINCVADITKDSCQYLPENQRILCFGQVAEACRKPLPEIIDEMMTDLCYKENSQKRKPKGIEV